MIPSPEPAAKTILPSVGAREVCRGVLARDQGPYRIGEAVDISRAAPGRKFRKEHVTTLGPKALAGVLRKEPVDLGYGLTIFR